jgi:hypothetical protein
MVLFAMPFVPFMLIVFDLLKRLDGLTDGRRRMAKARET